MAEHLEVKKSGRSKSRSLDFGLGYCDASFYYYISKLQEETLCNSCCDPPNGTFT